LILWSITFLSTVGCNSNQSFNYRWHVTTTNSPIEKVFYRVLRSFVKSCYLKPSSFLDRGPDMDPAPTCTYPCKKLKISFHLPLAKEYLHILIIKSELLKLKECTCIFYST
jgi:hypothetical protein